MNTFHKDLEFEKNQGYHFDQHALTKKKAFTAYLKPYVIKTRR